MTTKVYIDVKDGYDVIIGRKLLNKAGEIFKEYGISGKLGIVTDSNVAPLYLDTLRKSLEDHGYEVISYIFPAGEKSKNFATLSDILNFFAKSGMTRKDVAIALGGGVTGDITGFAAGVYMRGISYVQIPTTLLASVDSSVGGKTAVDLESGKNLAGVFIQPKLVISDTETLKTLDKEIYSDGMAEVIKTAILGDSLLFEKLESEEDIDEYIVTHCVNYKGKIVSEDEFEMGVRKLLNLGHTPAHSIEKLSSYTLSHGHAVGIGLSMVAKASYREGLLSRESAIKILKLLDKYSLSTECTYSPLEMAKEALFDKKREKNSINVIKISDIGKCIIETISTDKLEEFFKKGLGDI